MGKKTVLVLAVLALLLLTLPALNMMQSAPGPGPLQAATGKHPGLSRAATILGENCLHCHAPDADLPFYAGLPLVSGMIRQDITRGIRWMDMISEFAAVDGGVPTEAFLAKLEFVLERGLMPPSRYVLLHWDRALSGAEQAALTGWVREVRRTRYAVPGVADAMLDWAVRPLPAEVQVDATKVALGERLYHDVRLSGDDTVSCASCHALDKGGTDRSRTSTGIQDQVGPINAPTVFNSSFNVLQFWDGRAADLQEQAAGPVHNPLEMGSSWEEVISKLNADRDLTAEFTAVYPGGFSGENITDAIAEFERSLVTPNSRFDRYLMGEEDALTPEEARGHALFVENGCATCHVGAALGGRSFDLMGRNRDYFAERGSVGEADQGRFNATKEERDRHRFKVPILRNVALTYPYFHDGTREDLDGAVRAMAEYQAYRPFSNAEVGSVTSFLKTLTGEYRGRMLE